MRIVTFAAVLGLSSPALGYEPPKGIPDPASFFGAFGEIDQPTPDKDVKCPQWASTGEVDPSNKCYYIDKTFTGAASCTGVGAPSKCCTGVGAGPSCSAATNSGNPYGCPNKPRSTFPELTASVTLPPGAYVYVHAGTYVAQDSPGQNTALSGEGSGSDPIWVTGNPSVPPVIQDPVAIGWLATTRYLVLENFSFTRGYYTGRVSVGPAADDVTVDHIIVRDCTLKGNGTSTNVPNEGDTSDGVGIIVGRGGRAINGRTAFVVIYNVEVSDYGYSTGPGGGEETGVGSSAAVDHLWVLDSHIHNVGADAVAGCHVCRLGEDTRVEHYYIGRNRLHSDGENCIDLKNTRHIVISENDCTGPFQDEQGGGMVVHYGGGGDNTGSRDVWVLFNRVYRVTTAFACSGCGEGVHLIGNLFYDIDHTYSGLSEDGTPACDSASPPECGSALAIWGTSGPIDIVDNTMVAVEKGPTIAEPLSADTPLSFFGNIVSGRTDPAKYELSVGGGAEYVSIGNDLFDREGGAKLIIGGERDAASLYDTLQQCGYPGANTCIQASPLFVDAGGGDLRLQPTSPAISANTKHAVYDEFFSKYEVSIERDFASTDRPAGDAWDIGAYEFVPACSGADDCVTPPEADRVAMARGGCSCSASDAHAATGLLMAMALSIARWIRRRCRGRGGRIF